MFFSLEKETWPRHALTWMHLQTSNLNVIRLSKVGVAKESIWCLEGNMLSSSIDKKKLRATFWRCINRPRESGGNIWFGWSYPLQLNPNQNHCEWQLGPDDPSMCSAKCAFFSAQEAVRDLVCQNIRALHSYTELYTLQPIMQLHLHASGTKFTNAYHSCQQSK